MSSFFGSDSATTNNLDQNDYTSVGAGPNSVAVREGNITITDSGIVKNTLDALSSGLGSLVSSVEDVSNNSGQQFSDALDYTQSVTGKVLDSYRANLNYSENILGRAANEISLANSGALSFAGKTLADVFDFFGNVLTTQQTNHNSELNFAQQSVAENAKLVGTTIAGNSYQTAGQSISSNNTVLIVMAIAAIAMILPKMAGK